MLKLLCAAVAASSALASGQVFEVVVDKNTVDLDIPGDNIVTVSLYLDRDGATAPPWDEFNGWSFFAGVLAANGGRFQLPVESAEDVFGGDWIGRRPPSVLPSPGGSNGGFRFSGIEYTESDGEATNTDGLQGFQTALSGRYPGFALEGLQAWPVLGGFNINVDERVEVLRAELVFQTPGVYTVHFHPLDLGFWSTPGLTDVHLGHEELMGILDATVLVETEQPYISGLSADRPQLLPGKRIKLSAQEVIDLQDDISRIRFFRDSNHNNRLDNNDQFLGRDRFGDGVWAFSVQNDPAWDTAGTEFFAVAVDAANNRSEPVSCAVDVVAIGSPYIMELGTQVSLVRRSIPFRLRAKGVYDTAGTVDRVRFFRDANPDGKLGAGDEQLGTVTDISRSFVTFETQWQVSWGWSDVVFFAQAIDNDGNKSLARSLTVQFDPRRREPSVGACVADRNADGFVGVADLGDFLNAYALRDLSADVDGDRFVGPDDLVAFIRIWQQGCE